MNTVVIYHNPKCGTSRNTLAMIRNSGAEPVVIEYLKEPPDRAHLLQLLELMNLRPSQLLREKEPLVAELGLVGASEEAILSAMAEHPILINRPIVVTAIGATLCRPSELVLDILSNPQQAAFTKEDGEAVVDANGKRIAP